MLIAQLLVFTENHNTGPVQMVNYLISLYTDQRVLAHPANLLTEAKGNYAEAVEEFAKTQDLSGEQQTAVLMREGFLQGGWQGFLRAMTGSRRPASFGGSEIAVFHVALGEKDKAFAELDKCYEEFGRLLQISPRLDPLRRPAFR